MASSRGATTGVKSPFGDLGRVLGDPGDTRAVQLIHWTHVPPPQGSSKLSGLRAATAPWGQWVCSHVPVLVTRREGGKIFRSPAEDINFLCLMSNSSCQRWQGGITAGSGVPGELGGQAAGGLEMLLAPWLVHWGRVNCHTRGTICASPSL